MQIIARSRDRHSFQDVIIEMALYSGKDIARPLSKETRNPVQHSYSIFRSNAMVSINV